MPRRDDGADASAASRITHRTFLSLAIPFILSTVTQPLLGAVDTAVVGRLPDPACIGGVAVGAVIFNTMYWLFGFLRVGTTSLSAQAQGKRSDAARTEALAKPAVIALGIGCFIVLLRSPIFSLAMWSIKPSADVLHFSGQYYRILVWGAPVALLNYVMLGWLMGQTRLGVSLAMQIGGNLLNIVLDVLFVFRLDMAVQGVALATLISQLVAFAIGLWAIAGDRVFGELRRLGTFSPAGLSGILRHNANLLLRTVCLLIQINVFTSTGAAFGDAVLSANAVLYQIMMLISYSLDGLANTASVFAGRACGGRDRLLLRETWNRSFCWTITAVLLAVILFHFSGDALVWAFTDIPDVLAAIKKYELWVYVFPVVAGAGVSFYGIFTGMGDTGPVRNSTFWALALFLACRLLFVPLWGNDGLWLAFMGFYFGRSAFLLPYYGRTFRRIAAAGEAAM